MYECLLQLVWARPASWGFLQELWLWGGEDLNETEGIFKARLRSKEWGSNLEQTPEKWASVISRTKFTNHRSGIKAGIGFVAMAPRGLSQAIQKMFAYPLEEFENIAQTHRNRGPGKGGVKWEDRRWEMKRRKAMVGSRRSYISPRFMPSMCIKKHSIL